MDRKLNPAQRRASVRLAVKDAKRLLSTGLAWLDAGDGVRAAAHFEGAQGAAFDAKALLDPMHPTQEEYKAGQNDPTLLPQPDAVVACSVCGDTRHVAAAHGSTGVMTTTPTA